MKREFTMKNTKYDFESVIERKNTQCLKWDLFDDDLPMWVADMDFKVAPAISDAISKRANHPVFGYTMSYLNHILAGGIDVITLKCLVMICFTQLG